MFRRAVASLATVLALVLPLGLAGAVLPAAPASAAVEIDQLAVSVVGNGTTTNNRAVPVAIQLLNGSGTLGSRIELPQTASGANQPFSLGATSDQQGNLKQSSDHRFLTIAGYASPAGDIDLNGSAASAIRRSIARIAADGAVDTSTTLADAFSLRHVRGAASVDGSSYVVGGHGGDAPTTKGGLLQIANGGTTPTALVSGTNDRNNGRVPAFFDGQLYLSSDRTSSNGISAVAGDGTLTVVAATPSGKSVPHDYVLVGDTLYVGYTEGTAAIVKYERSGGTFTYVDEFRGTFWGMTGRQAGSDVVLYAVKGSAQGNALVRLVDRAAGTFAGSTEELLASAPTGHAFRGVAFAPGFTPGTGEVPALGVVPAITWQARVAGGQGNALSGVVGRSDNPVARGTVTDANGEAVSLTAASSNAAVVPSAAVAVQHDPATGAFAVAATPTGVGTATITLTARTADGRQSTSTLTYGASAAPTAPADVYVGMADASAAIDAGDGYFFVADDNSNPIRLYGAPGEPTAEFDFSSRWTFERPGEAHDFEAVARVGSTAYWVGSTGNTRSGNVRLDRSIVLATTVSGSGADARLDYVGSTGALRQALIDWDVQNTHGLGADHFGFFAATRPGVSVEGPNTLNIEGAAIAPDGTTLWLGFRSPITGGEALIVPVADIAGVVAGAAPVLGTPILLDLGGRAIREMARTSDGRYLIVAGSADDSGDFALFGWSGRASEAPVQATTSLGLSGWTGSYEGVTGVPSLATGTSVHLLLDSGTSDFYDTATEASDLPQPELRKFAGQTVTLDFGAVFDTKTITLPTTTLTPGQSYDLDLAGFAAGEQVTVELHSTPVRLATLAADASGRVGTRITIPADAAAGAHSIVVSATSGSASLAVTVRAAPGSGLAVTGAEVGGGFVAAGLLFLVGGGVLAVDRVRRRRGSRVS